MKCQITEGWIEIGPGNKPEDLLDIKERGMNRSKRNVDAI